MITQVKSSILVIFASILLISDSYSQQADMNNIQPMLSKRSYIKVYDNITAEFQKLFANAENVSWEKLNDDGFLAKFTLDGLKHRALLNARGALVYNNTYGSEKQLPVHIRKDVKREYVEFVITAAVHIEEDRRSIWVINLEDESTFVTVRVENNEIEEVTNYKKSR